MTLSRFTSFSFQSIACLAATGSLLTSCALPEYANRWANHNVPVTDETQTVRRAESSVANKSLFNTSVGFNVPRQAASLNDTARVLAGMPPAGSDHFASVRGSSAWVGHKDKLDQLWADFAWRHDTPIRNWAATPFMRPPRR